MFNVGWHIISDLSDRDFFDPFIFLADVIKLSKDIPNIMLGEVLPLGGPCGSPNVLPKAKNMHTSTWSKRLPPS